VTPNDCMMNLLVHFGFTFTVATCHGKGCVVKRFWSCHSETSSYI